MGTHTQLERARTTLHEELGRSWDPPHPPCSECSWPQALEKREARTPPRTISLCCCWGEGFQKTVSISTVYPLQAVNYCWASGANEGHHLSPEHMYMTCMLVLHMYITWRSRESQGLSLPGWGKEAGEKVWPRAAPGASNRGVQLHLVDSQPPKCHQAFGRQRRQGNPRAGAYGSAFPASIGKQSQGMQPLPSAWDAPALRNAEAALACECTCTCKYAVAHAHSRGREHQESWCRASCAPTTCPCRTECPMCLQESLKKGSCLPSR